MKSIFFAGLVVFVILLVLTQAFKNNFENRLDQQIQTSIASSTLTAPAKPAPPPTPGAAVPNPETFHGPTAAPHIIGPSSPPPNW